MILTSPFLASSSSSYNPSAVGALVRRQKITVSHHLLSTSYQFSSIAAEVLQGCSSTSYLSQWALSLEGEKKKNPDLSLTVREVILLYTVHVYIREQDSRSL